MKVFKIGGSVLHDIASLDYIAQNFVNHLNSLTSLPIVVISAFQNYTDELINMSSNFSVEPESFLITTGEQISVGLFSMALQQRNVKAIPLAAWQIPITINANKEISVGMEKINQVLVQGCIPVITGFQCINTSNDICDLGRGGSDLTAAHLANKFNAECVFIKQAGGICSADPALTDNYFIWKKVGYDNLLQLSNAGSRVLQGDAVRLIKEKQLKVSIADSQFNVHTTVSRENVSNFTSMFAYENRIRVISAVDIAGFTKKNGYYESDKTGDLHGAASHVTNIAM